MDIQEIRDLLEKAKQQIELGCGKTRYSFIDQALTLLKQQPTAGEFTKECRAMAEIFLESTKNLTEKKLTELLESDWNGVGFIMRIYGEILEGRLAAKDAFEACDRLDTAEAINKELLEACEAGLYTMRGISRITAELEAKGKTFTRVKKDEHENNIKIVEAVVAKAKRDR